ncbi:hypothetical protein [Massilia agri]|uniref:PEP-CTERM sorting domain-containing protein n=1 Tax=Massilia agri TaxID=1886785 RepID=A0ABT2AK91_9BURK|nr:hypothetical protein [Massilia agri]MCS0596608.1 hypothetical protein [Massilia agri]
MWKQTLAGLGLSLITLAPAAQAETFWEFSYTGFETGGVFDPRRELGGFFVGEDLDGDGVVVQGELSRFYLDSLEFDVREFSYCGGGGFYCEVSDFRYSLDGELYFKAEWLYTDEAARSTFYVTAGDKMEGGGYVGNGESNWTVWRWTDQTRFTISPPPVPEPGQATMAAGGLLVLGAWGAARRRARPAVSYA